MFTSRAEYRTLLRQDNADERLTPRSHALGLASDERLKKVEEKTKKRGDLVSYLKKTSFPLKAAQELLENKKEASITQTDKYAKLLSRPNITRKDLNTFEPLQDYLTAEAMNDTIFEQAEIEIKYAGYIEKRKTQCR
jgi:tRNA uridine 5-carboxymethylaminomethyl modification enzyme